MKGKMLLIGMMMMFLGVLGSERFQMIPEVENNHFHHLSSGSYLTEESNEDSEKIASDFLAQMLGGYRYEVRDSYVSKHNGVRHIYGRQLINQVPIANALFNLNIDSKGRVINFAESFFKKPLSPPETPLVDPLVAILNLAKKLNVPLVKKIQLVRFFADKRQGVFTGGDFSLDEIPVDLAFVQTEGGDRLKLAWHINVRREDNWFDAFVNAETGDLALLFDWAKGASYNVYPLPVNDPYDGDRKIVTDPHTSSTGSRLGWHDQGSRKFTDTRGNNVYAQENFDGSSSWENNYRPDGGSSLSFDHPVDFTKQPREYIDAAVTNLFYWNNIIHDIFYEYGFDEVSGNFQENNFGNGGRENDAVQANAQDGQGYNNANFATPPDGQRPRMRMYLWNQVSPMLDGDFDNGIIVHEYAHGISNRLAGGPANSGCMSGGQAGGMGEGHGDCFSVFFRWRPEYNRQTEFGMGEYAAGRGIRYYPYSYSMTTNPQTYSYINGGSYSGVHAKGCVWCTIIYDAFLDMIEQYGFDPDWYKGKGGNNVLLQLIVDGFKIGPCNPTFVQTRDAILLADKINYNGTYSCTLWRAFARRGLGVDAVDTNNAVRDDFKVPAGC